MIFNNLIATFVFFCLFLWIGMCALRWKRHILSVCSLMDAVAFLLLGIITDLPEMLRLSEYHTYYITLLLFMMIIFGLVIMDIDSKDDDKKNKGK